MRKVKPEIGMKVSVPRYNYHGRLSGEYEGTIIGINKRQALVELNMGYKESFYFKDLKCIK